jgi:hypothetical protein
MSVMIWMENDLMMKSVMAIYKNIKTQSGEFPPFGDRASNGY